MTSFPSSSTDYLVFVRPDPADGAVMREVVRVIRAEDLPGCGLILDPVAGASFLPEVGYVKIYNAEDMGLSRSLCIHLADLWSRALEYNRTGGTGPAYSEFLRHFGIANDCADRIVHATLTRR